MYQMLRRVRGDLLLVLALLDDQRRAAQGQQGGQRVQRDAHVAGLGRGDRLGIGSGSGRRIGVAVGVGEDRLFVQLICQADRHGGLIGADAGDMHVVHSISVSPAAGSALDLRQHQLDGIIGQSCGEFDLDLAGIGALAVGLDRGGAHVDRRIVGVHIVGNKGEGGLAGVIAAGRLLDDLGEGDLDLIIVDIGDRVVVLLGTVDRREVLGNVGLYHGIGDDLAVLVLDVKFFELTSPVTGLGQGEGLASGLTVRVQLDLDLVLGHVDTVNVFPSLGDLDVGDGLFVGVGHGDLSDAVPHHFGCANVGLGISGGERGDHHFNRYAVNDRGGYLIVRDLGGISDLLHGVAADRQSDARGGTGTGDLDDLTDLLAILHDSELELLIVRGGGSVLQHLS